MRRIMGILLMVLSVFNVSLSCYAAESLEENDVVTSNVYARYVRPMEQDDVAVVDGYAEVITNNGYAVSVTGIPDNVFTLRVVPIPPTETDAWSWFADCIGGKSTILSIFDIDFEDADGNRINIENVNISISEVNGEDLIFSVATNGNTAELDCTITNGSIAFMANGSHYYTLAKKNGTDSKPDNSLVIEESEGGDVEISDKNPRPGDTVTITMIPDDGKKVDKVVVKDGEGNRISVTDNGNGTYSYVQPDGKVTIEVNFKDEELISAEEYNVIIKDTPGGDVEISDMTPIAGQNVMITPKPNNRKAVNKVTVTDKNGMLVQVTDNGDGTYSYTQPANDVTIEVIFKDKSNSDKPVSPATGDESDFVLWTSILILSMLTLFCNVWWQRKKNENKG